MIGIFNENFPPVMDGVAITARNYAYWLHRKGHPTCVVTPYAPNADEILDKEPYPIYRYPSIPILVRKPYRYGVPQVDMAFQLRLRTMDFELVHAHCPFTSGGLARMIAKQQNIPMVATFHSKYRQDLIRAVPISMLVDKEIKRIISFYEHAYQVWIPQASVEPTLREYGFKGHVEVVENGNDFVLPVEQVQQYREQMRAELGLGKNETMFLFVGQLVWEKNIAFILDSLALIKHLPYRLYIVGQGYARDGIKEKIHQLGLENKVVLTGQVLDRTVLQRYDAAADLFLFPSLYDNAPLVVREAAAMHTPAVMLEGATAAEVICDGDNGFLCANDPVLYAERLHQLMLRPDTIRRAGEGAAQTLTRTWENVMDEVMMRYADIIKTYHLHRRQ